MVEKAKASVKKAKPAAKKSGTASTTTNSSKKAPAKGAATASKTTAAKRPSQKSSTNTAPAKNAKKTSSTTGPAKKGPASSTKKKAPATSSVNSSSKASTKKNQRSRDAGGTSQPDAPQLTAEEQRIQKLLGEGACHLPGNNWFQDWWMHLSNGHPFFSACFQHRLHPVSKTMRAVQMLGSVAMGLIITNVMYIWFIHDNKQDDYFEELTKTNNSTVIKMTGLTQ